MTYHSDALKMFSTILKEQKYFACMFTVKDGKRYNSQQIKGDTYLYFSKFLEL